MIKLIASDLDGTLLQNGAQEIPSELFPIIKEIKKMGILFVAASGRQYSNMKRLFEPVVNDMAFICENGALVIKDEKILYQHAFPDDLIKEIVTEVYNKNGAEFSCSTKDYYYLRPKTQEYKNLMLNVVKTDCKMIDDFSEITEPCIKAAVYEPSGVTDETIQYWRERFSDRCNVVTSGLQWTDFIAFGVNKAKGIQYFQQSLQISPEECMAFGDENNDIEMIRSVKYSFAMENARDSVKQAASYRTAKVTDILKELIKNNGKMEE